jgi:hypothetical protein
MAVCIVPLVILLLGLTPAVGQVESPDLARQATASASESHQALTPEKANDGNPATRWSGIPGHTSGVWFELSWLQAVRIAQVIIHQADAYVMEMDIQVWEAAGNNWRTVKHMGKPGTKLPRVVIISFPAKETSRLRIADITNGPTFSEVEVYSEPRPRRLSVQAASDLDGHILGIVTDQWGSEPVSGAQVTVSGRGKPGPWRQSVTSDGKGHFLAALPLGATATVEIAAIAAGASGQQDSARLHKDAGDFQYGLTPRSTSSPVESLNGVWRFKPDPPDEFWKPGFDDDGWSDISVPSHWEMEGYRSLAGIGGYRRRFSLPPGDGRLKLRFEGVYSGAEVWINGLRLAYHEGGATPFELDITEASKPGENLLAVRVTEHTRTSDDLDKMSLYADFPLAGIMRSVYLFRVPEAHIGALAISTRFKNQYKDALLTGRLAVLNESDHPLGNASLHFILTDLDGRSVSSKTKPVPVAAGAWERAEADFSLDVPSPRKWEAEHPNLYRLTIELRAEGRVLQTLEQRVGFRQTEVVGTSILINGKPVKLRGTCHHDTHPLLGRAVTPELTRKDLELMKEANLNAVRTSHYPPLPELLDLADELGLYVEDEASFCWVGVSDDLNYAPRIIQLTAELLTRDRNHPSVFMWSLCNESGFGAAFERSHEWVRGADPDRPTSAGTSASLEIATLHNPLAISRIDENERLDRPLLFDESLCIFQGIFGDVAEMWVDPGVRDYYVTPLPAIYDRFMKSRVTQGSFIWCWADDIFCVPNRGLEYGRGVTRSHFLTEQYALPGRGLTGDAPWGVVDGWRRPKPEFWITKKLHSPVKVAEKPLSLPEKGAPIRVPVENQYDFTDLSELRVTWELGEEKGEAKAAVPPHSAGPVLITPQRTPGPGAILSLIFTHPSGRLVDTYRLPLGEEPATAPVNKSAEAAPLVRRQQEWLAGIATHVIGKEFELAFDTGSGMLRRGVAFGLPMLLEFPALHVLPTASPLSPLADRLSWKLQAMETTKEGENIRLKIKGVYAQFQGSYDLVVTPSGEMSVTADFEYIGEDLWAREIGLRLSVPKSADLLEWRRRAEWNVYPPDHIGRPAGTARAAADHKDDLPPGWPWALDNSPMGSNDFRSTKRNILWAVLGYPKGAGVLVHSDGRHHARAIVETDRISLHINSWYGGTNAGWWEWEHNYGKGKLIKKGDHIQETLRLRLVRF